VSGPADGPLSDYVEVVSLNRNYDALSLSRDNLGFSISREGVSTIFYHSGPAMRFLAYIEFAEGLTRGNHYHNKRVEYMCVAKGRLLATYYLANDPTEKLTKVLNSGDIVRIQPGCVHAYLAQEFSVALEYSPVPFDEADTIRVSGDHTDTRRD